MSARTWIVSAVAAGLAFGLGTLLGTRLSGGESAQPRPALDAAPATPGGPAPRLPTAAPAGRKPFVGVVYAKQQAELSAAVEARLEAVLVQVGDHLRKGDVVAKLDAESIRRELAAATAAASAFRAQVRAAQTKHSAAKAKLARAEKLAGQLSDEEIEGLRYEERMAAADVESARARAAEALARAEQARTLLARAEVVAEFDGVVAKRYVDPGALVGPGRPIVKLISDDDLWVRFAVPEEQLGSVAVDGCVNVHVAALGGATTGTIATVAPQIDAASRMINVEARLKLPDGWRGRLLTGLQTGVTPVACGTNPER